MSLSKKLRQIVSRSYNKCVLPPVNVLQQDVTHVKLTGRWGMRLD